MKGAWFIFAGVGLALIGWAAWPHAAPGKVVDTASACEVRLRSLYSAISIYASDHEDRLPNAENWSESIANYLSKLEDLHCPSAASNGYAFHLDLQGAKLSGVASPAGNALVFDSSDLRKSAADNMQSLPSPPRHTRPPDETPLNNALYADGHAAMLKPQ
jgi:hypothetical protein